MENKNKNILHGYLSIEFALNMLQESALHNTYGEIQAF